ncbi:MAG TPA: L-idonate 5-dehydrogenase [Candidatus Binatia bacterium]|nr:L-idonate 5-dehydrogenase [Candidatus Binatia bacterium]
MLGAVLYGAKDLRVETCAVPELAPGQVLIRVRRAGICGSDLHYFAHGYCAAFVPTRPFILGHELIGEIVARTEDVNVPPLGARVVVNPARPCRSCHYCNSGRSNLCPRTTFLGSASTRPPTNGAFAEFVAVRADQCHLVPPQLDDALGAMMEPFAVALHAVKRPGAIAGKSALVIGGGPIGLLVALTARAFGATPVSLSDIVPARRQKALNLGIDVVLDPLAATLPRQVVEISPGGFDVIFEASGAPAALRQAFDLIRPGGAIVQIGTLGTEDIPLPANQVMVHELQFLGSFRYGDVFEEAIRLAASGRVNLQTLISQVLPMRDICKAMTLALAKDNVLKVQLQT